MSLFIAWLAIADPSAVDKVVSGLIRRGYVVGAASSSNNLLHSRPNCVSHALALQLETNEEWTQDTVMSHLWEITAENKIQTFFQMVLWKNATLGASTTWHCGNMGVETSPPKTEVPSRVERATREDMAE
jgi:hypothetical protein